MKARGLSIDHINRKYKGPSSSISPPSHVQNAFAVGAGPSRQIIGSPVSQIVQPAIRTSFVPNAVPLAQPSQVIRRSFVRSPSPVAISAVSPIAYPSLSPAITTTTVRRSRLAPVVPGPIVEQHIETYQQEQPIAIKKVVEVKETVTPGAVTQTNQAGGALVGVSEYRPRPYVPAPAARASCACPWWLWLLLGLLLAALLGLAAFNFFGGGKSNGGVVVKPEPKPEPKPLPEPEPETEPENKGNATNTNDKGEKVENTTTETVEDSKEEIHPHRCSSGFFFFGGECIKCPSHSGWNRTHCVIRKVTTVTTKRSSEVEMVPGESYGSSIKASSLSTSASLFSKSSAFSASSSSSSSSSESEESSTETIGEYMRKLGLDYESQRKKWLSEGSSGKVRGPSKGGEYVVEPIREAKVHEMERHHLRKHRI